MRRFLNVEGGRTYLAMHAFKCTCTRTRLPAVVMFVTGFAPVRNLCAFVEKYWPRFGRRY